MLATKRIWCHNSFTSSVLSPIFLRSSLRSGELGPTREVVVRGTRPHGAQRRAKKKQGKNWTIHSPVIAVRFLCSSSVTAVAVSTEAQYSILYSGVFKPTMISTNTMETLNKSHFFPHNFVRERDISILCLLSLEKPVLISRTRLWLYVFLILIYVARQQEKGLLKHVRETRNH